jgi:predicted NBD/HSP70 family sugar kinase
MNGISNQTLRDVLRAIYQQRTTSRAHIIEATGLSAGIISQALQLLLRSSMVLKIGELESNGGRRREVLTLNPDAAYFIGVDLAGHCVRFALASFGGDLRYRWEVEFEPDGSLDLHKLFCGIERVASGLNAQQRSRLQAVGVSYPGLMDQQGRLTAVNLGWRHFPLMAELDKVRNARGFKWLPIFFEQEVQSAVRVEQWLGRAQNLRNVINVSCDRGIGAGILVDGKVVEGWRNMAGELGHVTVDPAAEDKCNCGKRGCLEAIATSRNIVRQYLEKIGGRENEPANIRFVEVIERARKGETPAIEVVRRVCQAWGLALSHMVNLLNPEIIILGGELVGIEDLFVPLIREELLRHCLPERVEGLEIAVSTLGLDLRLKAAASLAFRKCLSDAALLKKMCSPVLASHRRAAIPAVAALGGE